MFLLKRLRPYDILYLASLGPEASPQHVAATATGSTTINLSWDPPLVDKQNGIITVYKVQCCKTDKSDPCLEKVIPSTKVTLESLSPFTSYTIKVFAGTSIGYGPSTEIIVETQEGRK